VLSPGQKVTFYQPSVALAGATPAQTSPNAMAAAAAPASAASGAK